MCSRTSSRVQSFLFLFFIIYFCFLGWFLFCHIYPFSKIICSLRPFQMAYSRNYVSSESLSKNNSNGSEENVRLHYGERKTLVPMPVPRWSKNYKWVSTLHFCLFLSFFGANCFYNWPKSFFLQNFLMNKKQNASNGINSSSTYRNWYGWIT